MLLQRCVAVSARVDFSSAAINIWRQLFQFPSPFLPQGWKFNPSEYVPFSICSRPFSNWKDFNWFLLPRETCAAFSNYWTWQHGAHKWLSVRSARLLMLGWVLVLFDLFRLRALNALQINTIFSLGTLHPLRCGLACLSRQGWGLFCGFLSSLVLRSQRLRKRKKNQNTQEVKMNAI